MPLTAAERMKRYREKLKADPEKYIQFKKKHAQLVKNKTKKINELNEEEQEKLRKKWREQKKKHKKREIQCEESSRTQKINKKSTRANNKSKIMRQFKAALKKNNALIKALQTTKKQFYRYKVKTSKEIEQLQKCVIKMKAREEVLEYCLKSTYTKCGTQKEKRLLKDLVNDEKVTKAKMKTKCSNMLGLKGKIRKSKEKVKNIKTSLDIKEFYIRDDVSRCTAGKKECRTLGKKKEQIRYLLDTLGVLYKKYKSEGGKHSFTTFYRYKPFFVLSPNIKNRDTCLCVKHSNIEIKLHALQKHGLLAKHKTMTEILSLLSCDLNSYDCMFSRCQKCNKIKLDYKLENINKDTELEWFQWERINHTYEKNEKGGATTATTKKTAKVKKTGTINALIKSFEMDIPAFKKHYFTWIHQQRQYQKCINEMKENEALIICDFSENYQCKLESEIQSMHFGASKAQITLHTGMIYWKGSCQSFCTVSDSTCHEPQAIWAHLIPVVKLLREIKPNTKVIHFYSDGPSSQYRQKKNFYLHNLFTCKLGLNFSTWSFTESGHGKGVADGIGGSVKRALDRQVSYGRDISNAKDAHQVLQNCMKTVKCLLINDKDIDNINKIVPKNLKPVPGTMQIHQITSSFLGEIMHRTHSCFCSSERGMGGCYSPQKYSFDLSINKNHQEKRHEMRDVIEHLERNENMKINKLEDKKRIKNEQHKMVNKICSDQFIEGRQDESEFEIQESYGDDISHIMHKIKEDSQTTSERICEMIDDKVIVIDPKYEWEDKVIVEMNDDLELSENMYIIKVDQEQQINEENSVSKENIILQDITMNKSANDFVVSESHEDELLPHASSQYDCHSKRTFILKSKKYKTSLTQPKKCEVVKKENKALRTIIKRKIKCHSCKNEFPFQTCTTKCMVCKQLICLSCSQGQQMFDYICDTCLGE